MATVEKDTCRPGRSLAAAASDLILGQCSTTDDALESYKKGSISVSRADLALGGTAPNTGEGQSEGCTKIVVCTLMWPRSTPIHWLFLAEVQRDFSSF